MARVHKSSSHTIKFNNFKNEPEEGGSEIIIPERSEDTTSKVCERGSFQFLPKLILIFFLLIIFLSSVYCYYLSPREEINICDYNGQNHEGRYDFTNPCLPLHSVSKVTITLAKAPNYSCHDHVTCTSLQRRITEKQYGLYYNFVVGSHSELYLGMGFRCRVSNYGNESTLEILVLRDDVSKMNSNEEYFRISEIIEQGRICEHISPNYTVSTDCTEPIQECEHLSYAYESGNTSRKPFQFHDPHHDFGMLLHKDFKWIACGEPSEESKGIIKRKVITLESLPRNMCLPYKPVNHVSVDIVQTPLAVCADNTSCADMAQSIEEQHDGMRYNFVIGTHLDLYVGLGFRCRADYRGNTLHIKVLRLHETFQQHALEVNKLAELLQQGKDCGKIVPNYSISSNCQNMGQPGSTHCISTFENLEDDNGELILFAGGSQQQHFDDEAYGGTIVKHHLKLMICHSPHPNKQDISQPSSETASDFVYNTPSEPDYVSTSEESGSYETGRFGDSNELNYEEDDYTS